MTGYQRTIDFVEGKAVDRPPFMPLTIEWISKVENIPYSTFVHDAEKRAGAYLNCANTYHLDCILPDADFYEQLEDIGVTPIFENGAYHAAPIIKDIDDLSALQTPTFLPDTRMGRRLQALRQIAAAEKGKKYIFGICVGPMTEFCNAREISEALCDILDDEEAVKKALDFFFENCMNFIEKQLEAGADGIQIVEPCCSLISPALYEKMILPYHKKMVERIQRDGGFARLHICGDTNQIIPLTLSTGTRILDVDSAVDIASASAHLAKGQVFCGNLDSSKDILLGDPCALNEKVKKLVAASDNRVIVAAGCDIPPDTSVETMQEFFAACKDSYR